MKITEEQSNVTEAKEGPYLVLALAGSGKTFCITNRIKNLVKNHSIPSENILALTFTTKAAKEMSERIEKEIGTHETTICTFHALAYKAFTLYKDILGYKEFEIVGYNIVKSKMLDIYKEQNRGISKEEVEDINKLIPKISELKRADLAVEDIIPERYIDLYLKTEREMKLDSQATFDDLIYKICELFKKNEKARENFAKKFQYIIVDESQDTNKIQFTFMQLLNHTNNLMLVGDINQSIYRFQGAEVENIMNFDEEYKPEILYLSKNFRSNQKIIDVSNRILDYSLYDDKYRKKAVAHKIDATHFPKFTLYKDEQEQASRIADKIGYLVSKGYKPNSFSILYRNNSHSLLFEKELIKRGIPFTVKGGSFINRKEVQFILSCLKLSRKEYKRERLSCYTNICNAFTNNISYKTVQLVYAFDEKKDFEEIIRSGVPIKGIGTERRKSLNKLIDYIDEVKLASPVEEEYGKKDSLNLLISIISDVFKENAEDNEEYLLREEGLKLFKEIWLDYFNTKKSQTLRGFISDFMLNFSIEGEDPLEDKKEKDSVVLSTVHSYKGLERDIIFVVNVRDGLFVRDPNKVTDKEYMDDINLFYVACSRARDRMYISAPENATVWFYREKTYSLLQMFMGEQLLEGIEEHRRGIIKPTNFYYHLENKFV